MLVVKSLIKNTFQPLKQCFPSTSPFLNLSLLNTDIEQMTSDEGKFNRAIEMSKKSSLLRLTFLIIWWFSMMLFLMQYSFIYCDDTTICSLTFFPPVATSGWKKTCSPLSSTHSTIRNQRRDPLSTVLRFPLTLNCVETGLEREVLPIADEGGKGALWELSHTLNIGD